MNRERLSVCRQCFCEMVSAALWDTSVSAAVSLCVLDSSFCWWSIRPFIAAVIVRTAGCALQSCSREQWDTHLTALFLPSTRAIFQKSIFSLFSKSVTAHKQITKPDGGNLHRSSSYSQEWPAGLWRGRPVTNKALSMSS